MKYLRRIVKNGHSLQIALPRPLLDHLRWMPGDGIVIELNADGDVTLRVPKPADMRANLPPMDLVSTGSAQSR